MWRSELGFFDQLVVEGDQNSVVLISLHPQDRGNDILIHKIWIFGKLQQSKQIKKLGLVYEWKYERRKFCVS